MNVFKFGGASVKDAQGFKNVANILSHFKNEKLAIVVSATGKTTNELEEVVRSYFANDGTVHDKLRIVLEKHAQIINNLDIDKESALADIQDLFVEIDWIVEDSPQDTYDYVYDQIVSIGELISSKILYYTFVAHGHKTAWLDIRNALFTDEVHREAKVLWEISTPKIKQQISDLLLKNDIVVTQGFIGSTKENHTTTLGREGSDYTAAILSYCCDAEAMHIWKDVPGVLTGDPRKFDKVTKIENLSFKEAIEMTYYGAKVIHPKTIKPIQNKNIPLYVRPFDDVSSLGTKISNDAESIYPPIIVLEPNQALVNISVKDFSFVAENHLSYIFSLLHDLRIKVNMMRNTAISFTICIENNEEKIKLLSDRLSSQFFITIEGNRELVTIRHYTEEILAEFKKGRATIFEEKLPDMVQIVVNNTQTSN
jgi:aspartate kinase